MAILINAWNEVCLMYPQLQNIANGQLRQHFTKKGNHDNSEAEMWNAWQISHANPNQLNQLIKLCVNIFQIQPENNIFRFFEISHI